MAFFVIQIGFAWPILDISNLKKKWLFSSKFIQNNYIRYLLKTSNDSVLLENNYQNAKMKLLENIFLTYQMIHLLAKYKKLL